VTLATVTGIGDVLLDRGVGLRSSTVSSDRWNRSAGPLRASGSAWAISAAGSVSLPPPPPLDLIASASGVYNQDRNQLIRLN